MIGQIISHYRILSVLGHGAMGVVYEAEDMRLGRRVALKLLPENLARNPTAFQRLQREARAACRLNHPNICTIHEIEEQNGQPVIVMELLDGQSLKDRLAEGPIPFSEVLDLGIQMADALSSAHELGIIHRDIKPANIFLTQHGSIKILDFGLAKLVAKPQPGAEDTLVDAEESLTEVGVIPGTASYMSPEQAKGEPLDARTDLFSLGVVLYELATGVQPFRRKNRILTTDAILNSQPAPASRKRSGVPVEFDTIVAKALAKDPAQRYQTAAELRDALWNLKSSRASAPSSSFSYRDFASERASVGGAKPAPTREPRAPIHAGRVFRNWKLVLPATLFVVVVAVIAFFHSRRAAALTEKDTIVLADFDNKTGDPVFDETLKQALVVDLGQSPFLNILSDRKVAATLRLMGRPPEQRVTGEVARELCQRVGSKAMLAGSISSLGNSYVIGLNAINCATGDALVEKQVQARAKEDVLKALGDAATELRGKLGESLASVQKFSTPIEEATTSSLEALKAYSMGRRVLWANGDVPAIPYYQRALEIDPNFALCYSSLAVAYNNLGQAARASENAKKAYELRSRVSEREKYRIGAFYYSFVTGELEKGNQVYALWKQSYPRDVLAPGNLGDNYMRLGQWEKAMRETEEGIRLEPNSAVYHSNLASMQLALSHTEEASATLKQALARKLDSHELRVAHYQIAFLRNDQESIQQQLDWVSGRLGEEDWLLSTQSDTEAYFGRLGKAREFSHRAVESARRADAKETAAVWQANAALREAEFGNASSARENAKMALGLMPGRDVRCVAALALARAGDSGQAQRLAESLNQEFPVHAIVQGYWLPSIRAAIELNAKNSAKAVEILQTATPYELGQSQPFLLGMMYPVFLRGQAYLVAYQAEAAATEFQKIIDHRGLVLNFPLGALAHLGLARAYAVQGDTGKSRAAYTEFLNLWKTADSDIPVLRQAKIESSKLH
jgi:serine/threonine protein kinase/tetratricopeptide (TPR) repeat protein